MSSIVALGEAHRVEGFALGGARVVVASDADAVRNAWSRLPADVDIVVLTPAAATALADAAVNEPLRIVLP